MGHSRALSLYYRLFNTFGNILQMFILNFANELIQTVDLWYWKQPLYQLCHNHCPLDGLFPVFLVRVRFLNTDIILL